MADFKRYIIAYGGQLKKPTTEVLELNKTDKKIEEGKFETFGAYCKSVIQEKIEEHKKTLSKCLVLDEDNYSVVKQLYYVD